MPCVAAGWRGGRPALTLGLAVVAFASGCRGTPDEPRLLTVSVASSLGPAMTDLAASFEAAHPDVEVALNLAGSSSLREQILAGAGVDVFAAADRQEMAPLAAADALATPPRPFASNRMAIAVRRGVPSGWSLESFAEPELLVGLCAQHVPCGRWAHEVLERGGVEPSVDSREPHVRALVTKVAEGELDLGLVYESDLLSAEVDSVAIPAEHNVVVSYPIAVLSEARVPEAARAFVTFVLAAPGQRVLARYGFGPP